MMFVWESWVQEGQGVLGAWYWCYQALLSCFAVFNCLLDLWFSELYISGVKFTYVSVDYSVCYLLVCVDVLLLKEIVLLWVWLGFLFLSPCIVLHIVYVFCLWFHLLFRCSFHMFVLCWCMREVISRFKPFSVGSHGLLVRVVSLSVILCVLARDCMYYAFCMFVVSDKAASVSSVYCFQFAFL